MWYPKTSTTIIKCATGYNSDPVPSISDPHTLSQEDLPFCYPPN